MKLTDAQKKEIAEIYLYQQEQEFHDMETTEDDPTMESLLAMDDEELLEDAEYYLGMICQEAWMTFKIEAGLFNYCEKFIDWDYFDDEMLADYKTWKEKANTSQ